MIRHRRYNTSPFQPLEFLESRTMLSTSPITIVPNKPQNQAQLQARVPKILAELGANPINQVAGQEGQETLIAAFKSDLAASKASVTINWGDGSYSAGSVRALNKAWHSGQVTQYAVYGSHTYQTVGNFVVTISVIVNAPLGKVSGTTTSTATVTDPPAPPITPAIPSKPTAPEPKLTGMTIHKVVGDPGDPRYVSQQGGWVSSDPNATQRDSTVASSNVYLFEVMIDWGDGSAPTAGRCEQGAFSILPAPPTYYIKGSHVYTTAGTYTITITGKNVFYSSPFPANSSLTIVTGTATAIVTDPASV